MAVMSNKIIYSIFNIKESNRIIKRSFDNVSAYINDKIILLSSSSITVVGYYNDQQQSTIKINSRTTTNAIRTISRFKRASLILLIFLWFAFISFANGLKILHSSIPPMVDATNASAVILDCVYSYDPGDVKLVVRWFHNDSPEPIYQWIPEPDIRYVGELIKPYFDMDFVVSHDRYSKYRALRLIVNGQYNFPVALSGNYSCVISSIANQDSRQSQMIVYVPPKIFNFHFIELSDDRIALECQVEGVFPEPILTFSEQFSSNFTHFHRFPPVNVSVTFSDSDSYLYSASFLHPIQSVLTAGTIYECRLQLPGTTYLRKKRIKIIFPTSYVMKSGHHQHQHQQQQKSHAIHLDPNGTNSMFLVGLILALLINWCNVRQIKSVMPSN